MSKTQMDSPSKLAHSFLAPSATHINKQTSNQTFDVISYN